MSPFDFLDSRLAEVELRDTVTGCDGDSLGALGNQVENENIGPPEDGGKMHWVRRNQRGQKMR